MTSLLGWNSENEKTESVNENENKENKNVDVFQEYILQQKLLQKWKHRATRRGGMPHNKSFIHQASSVKIVGYWPHSLFAFLRTSVKTAKENLQLANMQTSVSRPISRAWWIKAWVCTADPSLSPKPSLMILIWLGLGTSFEEETQYGGDCSSST